MCDELLACTTKQPGLDPGCWVPNKQATHTKQKVATTPPRRTPNPHSPITNHPERVENAVYGEARRGSPTTSIAREEQAGEGKLHPRAILDAQLPTTDITLIKPPRLSRPPSELLLLLVLGLRRVGYAWSAVIVFFQHGRRRKKVTDPQRNSSPVPAHCTGLHNHGDGT